MAVSHPVDPALPTDLQVEVTGACNLRCKMCLVSYRKPLSKSEGALDYEDYLQLLDALPGLRRLTLQGLGEPLLSPHIFEMVEQATGRGIDVGFNTNAMLLTRRRSDRLVECGLGWLHVSLDGATAQTYESIRGRGGFDRVVANLRELVASRLAAGTPKPRIQVNVVAMRMNYRELPELVDLCADIGADRLWVQNLSHSFDDTAPAGSYRGIREFAAEEALRETDDAVSVFARTRQRAASHGLDIRLPEMARAGADGRAASTPACTWPWDSAYITHDGVVQPCCMVMGSDRADLGRLSEDSFAQIWSGHAYRRFRAGLLNGDPPAVCRGCSVYQRRF
jgi:radical SAM protein with 4Fe4S-binding SPASM domain